MTVDVDAAFGELRSLVHGTPSVRAFSAICRLAQSVEEVAPGVFADTMLDYAQIHLEPWPIRTRTISVPIMQAKGVQQLVWSPLIRGVSISSAFTREQPREYVRQVRDLGWCEHVCLKMFDVRQIPLEALVSEGFFDGFRSVEVSQCNLVEDSTWCVRLGERPEAQGLEELRMTGPGTMSSGFAEALVEGGLAERLRVLGVKNVRLRSGSGFDPSVEVAPLAQTLERFGRLERLELSKNALDDATVRALAKVRVPHTLRHVGMDGNAMSPGAIEAWVEAGRVGWWLDRAGPVALNTTGFRFDRRMLQACAAEGLFDEVERWTAGSRSPVAPVGDLTHLSVVSRHPEAFAMLREFDAGREPAEGDWQADLPELFEHAPLRVFRGCPPDDDVFARLLASPWAQWVRELSLGAYRVQHGEHALGALLDWGRLEDVDALDVSFDVATSSQVYARALATKAFTRQVREERALLFLRRYHALADDDACVNDHGAIRSIWLVGWTGRQRGVGGTE